MHSAPEARTARAAIGTLNEGALHAQLKDWYRRPGDRVEQLVDGFVVDLVRGELLVEIQTGSFAPLRRKLEQLTRRHRVRLVAPVPLVRTIVRLSDEGEPLSSRRSPRRGRVEDIFNRLVSIPALLGHPRFELELLLTHQDELRVIVRCARRPAGAEDAGAGRSRSLQEIQGAAASAIRIGLSTSAAVRRINLVSVSRLQSYVDAILAIAATLLILNVTVTGGGSLSHSLVHAWPSYAAYAVSFLTIGVIWINHHAILRLIEQPDPLFVIQNLLLLLFVAFLPFPTHVLADALRSGHGAPAAAVFYGISATLMAASFNALWIYASHGGRLLRTDAPKRVVAGITRSFRPGIALYAAATVVGLFSAWASASLYAAITLFYVISGSTFSRE